MARRTDIALEEEVEVESSAVNVVRQHVDTIEEAGFRVTPNISVAQTAQQLVLDMETQGAQ